MSGGRDMARPSVTVNIAGERHVLRSDASPEYTRKVAAHVDETIRSLGPSLDPPKAAILAALTITDELFRAREEIDRIRAELARRATRLSDLLDRVSTESAEPSAEENSPG